MWIHCKKHEIDYLPVFQWDATALRWEDAYVIFFLIEWIGFIISWLGLWFWDDEE